MIGELINDIRCRASTLCQLMSISYPSITTKMSIELFKRVLCERTDIFYDRHPDQLMMCCLYAVLCAQSNTHARKARQKPEVGFQKIAEAYMKMNRDDFGSEIPYTILHRVKNCSKQDDQFGDVIFLHNNVFMPAVKSFWGVFKDKVLEAQSSEAASNKSLTQANEEDEDKSKEMDVETSDSQENELPVSAEVEKEVEQESIAKNVDQRQGQVVSESKDNDQQEVEEVLETKDATQLNDEEDEEEAKPIDDTYSPTKGGFTLPDQFDSSSSSSSEEDEHEGAKETAEKKADSTADYDMDVDDIADDSNNKQLDDYDNSDADSNDTMDDLIERDNIDSQNSDDEDKEPLAYL